MLKFKDMDEPVKYFEVLVAIEATKKGSKISQ